MKYTIFYCTATAIFFQGILFKTVEAPGGGVMWKMGALLSIVYIVIGLREIYKSTKVTEGKKMAWAACFILFSTVTGFVYLFKRTQIV